MLPVGVLVWHSQNIMPNPILITMDSVPLIYSKSSLIDVVPENVAKFDELEMGWIMIDKFAHGSPNLRY